MIVWDKLNIANNSLASGVTLTPKGGQYPYLEFNSGIAIHGIAHTTINQDGATFTIACDAYRPNGASYNQILNLQYQATNRSSNWSANYYAGENFLETDEIRPVNIQTQTATVGSLICRLQNNCQASISGQQITIVDNSGFDEQTTIQPAKIISQNWLGSTTISGGNITSNTATFNSVTVNGKLVVDEIAAANTVSIKTYSTSASGSYKITLMYHETWEDLFAPDDEEAVEATESGILTIMSSFNKIYDIYFIVGKGGQIPAWGHADAWWFIEAPIELQTLMQELTVIDMEAREYEHCEYTGTCKTLEGFKSQWQLSYFTCKNKHYLGLGLDSNTSANNRISGIGHIRLIAN